ncbi:extensin [Streptomyces mirabilis]
MKSTAPAQPTSSTSPTPKAAVPLNATPAAPPVPLPVQRSSAVPPVPLVPSGTAPTTITTPATPAVPPALPSVQRDVNPTSPPAYSPASPPVTPPPPSGPPPPYSATEPPRRPLPSHAEREEAPPTYTAVDFDARSLTQGQIDELTHKLSGPITRLLRTELRLERERIGKLRDPRR